MAFDAGSRTAGSRIALHEVGKQWFRPSIQHLQFASCYAYAPRDKGAMAELARLTVARLKRRDVTWLPRYAADVFNTVLLRAQLPHFFDGDSILVPVPSSCPIAGEPWAAETLAVALHGLGLARRLWLGLRRVKKVRKSATALAWERPSVEQHYESFAVGRLPAAAATTRIILVDDVITKGRTFLAGAARLQEAFPAADIRAFALMRTLSPLTRATHLLQPCQGFIRWAAGDARRDP